MSCGAEGFRAHEAGLLLTVHVSPGAKQTKILGWKDDAAGRPQLRLRVSAPPEKGKANEAVLKLLAATFGLPRTRLRLMSGETGRVKTVLIEGGDGILLGQTLREALSAAGLGGGNKKT